MFKCDSKKPYVRRERRHVSNKPQISIIISNQYARRKQLYSTVTSRGPKNRLMTCVVNKCAHLDHFLAINQTKPRNANEPNAEHPQGWQTDTDRPTADGRQPARQITAGRQTQTDPQLMADRQTDR